jgi:nitroreductase/NAD-dependent dihydropyrimidine dehydrogenase PreA subunit
MIDFAVDRALCTKCNQCVADCPARIITMGKGGPAIAPEQEASCYRCQHCLAVCPVGAVSILGLRPEGSRPLAGGFPDGDQMETLIKGRRSVRRYREENLEPELLQRLLDVACHAPSAMNSRKVRFTLVDDRNKLARLRDDLMAGLVRIVRDGALPPGLEFLAGFVKLWEEQRVDFLFRGAPHLLIASAPANLAGPVQDCLIALSYFELFAGSLGVGAVWDGLAKLAICDLMPEFRGRLGIPEDHVIGYAMAFGRPAVQYARTAQHGPAEIHRVG